MPQERTYEFEQLVKPELGKSARLNSFLISPVAFSYAIGDFSVAVVFIVRLNLPMAIFKENQSRRTL